MTPEEAVAARVLPLLEPAAPVDMPDMVIALEPEEVPVAAEPEPEAAGTAPEQGVEVSAVWGQCNL